MTPVMLVLALARRVYRTVWQLTPAGKVPSRDARRSRGHIHLRTFRNRSLVRSRLRSPERNPVMILNAILLLISALLLLYLIYALLRPEKF